MRTDFIEKVKDITGNSAINTIVNRFLNQALHDMHLERWWWAERRSAIRTIAPYSTGTVDVAVTSLTTRRTVTGTSTVWTTTNSYDEANAVAGYKMLLGDSAQVHLVATVGGAGDITLDSTTPFTGTEALDDAGYTLYQDEYAPASDFSRPNPIDMKFLDEDRTITLVGAQEFERIYPRNERRGKPQLATIKELGPSGSVSLRPRLVLGPAPDAVYVIPYRYSTTLLAVSSAGAGAANLSADADQPIVPLKYRPAIVAKALELWFDSREKGSELAARWKGKYDEMMLRARSETGQAEDRPRIRLNVGHYWRHRTGAWSGPAARRHDGGTAWDQMRV